MPVLSEHRRPGRRRTRLACVVFLAVFALLGREPRLALGLEPTTVRVQGAAEIGAEKQGPARERAFRAALEEAVLEVARLFVPPGTMQFEEERIREALGPRAPAFVLTYRIHGAPQRRRSQQDPAVEELVLELTATVDAGQVRGALATLGVVRAETDRPSIALRVQAASSGSRQNPGLYTGFEQFLLRKLEREGFVVVDPALRAAGGASQSALDLARGVGADIAVEVAIRWRQRELSARMVGGVAEASVRALRARDGAEVGKARFDAPGYHEDPDEALLRGLAALQVQLADNLVLQLQQNWRELSREAGPVAVQLSNVTSFLQVEAVRRTLRDVLGARDARLVELGPGSAELLVRAPLSPGALQDRLAAVAFEEFRLEPVEVGRDRIQIRVAAPTGARRSPPAQP